ncbi:MAG: PD40 domain-containing protein [Candidatus Aminicenantes bacterium]|nr:PD40 domain-containing protein [Candidatus Aminicenantes bacterium]
MPDINGDLIVFVYAGDIWSVPSVGGNARRLTSHLGLEIFPKISPDGRWIAFSGEYSGSRQIYVMPASGGTPRQLTFYNDVGLMPPRGGFDNYPLDWTPDSKAVLFRANRTPYGVRIGKYFLARLDGGLETPLQIPEAGGGTFSPSGNEIVYTPISREFRTWKRYKGGRAQDVWIYDLEENTSNRLTSFEGTDQNPIWYGDKIYFVSDRELILNIFAYDLKTEQIAQITRHADYDVLWPSGEAGKVVYENGGELFKLDLENYLSEKIPVNINYDFPALLPYFKNVKDTIASFDISPTGKRAVFEARGDIFTVPAENGITYNLTRTQGVREMNPAWSPNGRYIAYDSDSTGEYELYIIDKADNDKTIQVTTGSKEWRYPAVWSPDSSMLLFSDKNLDLQFLELKTKKKTKVDKARRFDITNYVWSPDSRWIAYTKDGENGQLALWVYSIKDAKSYQLTDDMYNDYSPVFSTDGKYLLFLSDRSFNLSFSSFEFDYVYNKATRIHAVALTAGVAPLIKEENDKEEVKKEVEEDTSGSMKKIGKKADESKTGESNKEVTVEIDFSGINDRIIVLPPPHGDYRGLAAVDGAVLYFSNGSLHRFSFADKKDESIIAGIRNGAISADGKKFMYQSQDTYGIIDIQANKKSGDGALNLDSLTMKIDPRSEWQQIYNDGWKIYRDWFYVKNMHGVDWLKVKEKYGRLLPYVAHRADLDFIFGEMVGELNVGHAYVNWGDFPRVERVNTGLLGAELKTDIKSGRYIIDKILDGENWNEDARSPLTEQGILVKPGDFLIRLNGRDVSIKNNPYEFLENTAGKKISIVVNDAPTAEGAREYWITPVSNEHKLFYLNWVRTRRQMVDRLSGGRIGYIHVPNTSIEGNQELFKGMYAFQHKDALIIDERYNGGGFIPDVMINLLSRSILNYIGREGLKMTQVPEVANEGPKAMLINYNAGSGGDAFPYYFKKLKLGTLIGTRTWGGLVGLSGNAGLVDGGYLGVPTFGFISADGEWTVEGLGVAPDIEILDRPELVAQGRDPSLEKAVEILMEQLEKNPPRKVQKPQEPDRSTWHEKKKKK